jgi:hypothetical protein
LRKGTDRAAANMMTPCLSRRRGPTDRAAFFSDIKGSMELIQGSDPEEARRILDPTIAAMMSSIMEAILLDSMFDLPSLEGVKEIVISQQVVDGTARTALHVQRWYAGKLKRRIPRKRRENKVAKGQLRRNREKKKPKAEKNKRKSTPAPSVFERVRMIEKDGSGKKF